MVIIELQLLEMMSLQLELFGMSTNYRARAIVWMMIMQQQWG